MAKYLFLKHYRGAPASVNDVPMDQWTPAEIEAHIQYMQDFADRLRDSGEYVDSQALQPEGAWVRHDGEGKPPVTDGPFAETKDLIAGYMSSTSTPTNAPSNWPVSCPRLPVRAASRSTSGSRCVRSWAAPTFLPSDVADAVDEAQLRDLIPGVLMVLVRRGADFATAEDAVQEALVRAIETWPKHPPDDPKGWLITTAWRRFLDIVRSEAARNRREQLIADEPPPGPTVSTDDTLQLYFLCAHPNLSPASAVALTLRAVGGLTTRQIAQAYLVPEATMAQRISRAKRTVSDVRLGSPGDVRTVLKVLYLVFNEGYSGDVDLAAEAIRLARQLAAMTDDPEVAGLLALFLLHHARRPSRTRADGSLVPLADQNRSLWQRD